MALAETAELVVRLSLKDQFSSGVGKALGSVNRLDSGFGRAAKGAGQLAGGIARAGVVLGGVAITGFGAAAKAAIDFEDAFAGVRKTVNEADLAAAGLTFEELAKQFRTMATEIPVAATELARIGEVAGALGIKAQDIDDFTKTVALLGVTTDLTSDAAAEALGKVGTILGLTGKEFEDFADVLVNLGNQGASTESEIIEVTKRFAAMGKQAGLTTEEILALSSAATSLGAEPEAAGSALSRIFANMSSEIALATDKGKAFADATGDSLDELKRRIDQGDALGILMETLDHISGLSRTEAASVLKALGINNVRDRDAILKMAQNLGFVNDQLQIANESSGALGKEATARFNTIASKIQLVKNNLTEAAIVIGEGMLPAIGRLSDKLIAFLKDADNLAKLKKIGQDIGAAIDSIDIAKVMDTAEDFVGVLKGALDIAKGMLDVFQKLPKEVQAATVGFLALNKLSGGLIGGGLGNIIGGIGGGLGRNLASKIPVIGKAFVQPVFVTNMPLGGFGGGIGGAAGGGIKGLLGTAIRWIVPIGVGLAIVEALKGPLEQALDNLGLPSPETRATRTGLVTGAATGGAAGALGNVARAAAGAAAAAQGQPNAAAKALSTQLYASLVELRDTTKALAGKQGRINFLGSTTDAAAAKQTADYLASRFAQSNAPFYDNMANAERTLAAMKQAQAHFYAAGDTATAAALGANIRALESAMKIGLTAGQRAVNSVKASTDKVGTGVQTAVQKIQAMATATSNVKKATDAVKTAVSGVTSAVKGKSFSATVNIRNNIPLYVDGRKVWTAGSGWSVFVKPGAQGDVQRNG